MPRKYHWIMTLQWSIPGTGFGLGTADGVSVGGNGTRMERFREIRKVAAETIGAPVGASVVFFAIEREEQM
ncbi:hypothetical protein AB0J48_20625 [Nocardia salmonicida]|uniref:hypothetical protein n=1 Tax=Nocardia salmonicida TaxID=53431 RepID=UPI003426C4C5